MLHKLKLWHFMPLSILLLILAATFVWFGRGNFSTRNVILSVEGPEQIENGKVETFLVKVNNKSGNTLKNVNLYIETPGDLKVQENMEAVRNAFDSIEAGKEKEFKFSIVASSSQQKESINVRLDYSPEGVSARFVSVSSRDVVIGKLDASIIFDLPEVIYNDQEITGSIHILPNSDIATSPIYLKLDFPQVFELREVSEEFDFNTVWKLGTLKKQQSIKREFRGKLSSYIDNPKFKVSVGSLDGISFLPLNSVEKTIAISSSPIVLSQELIVPDRGSILQGKTATIKISYFNKSNVSLEDVIIKTQLPKNLIDFSTVSASGAILDPYEGTIEWSKAKLSKLEFIPVDEEGSVNFSFRALESKPVNARDVEKLVQISTKIYSDKQKLSLNGSTLQAENTASFKLSTKLSLEQDVYRTGGPFVNTGVHPPVVGEFTTYTVRWNLMNTTNKTHNIRIETVLPNDVLWLDKTTEHDGNLSFSSKTKTVIWTLDTLSSGIGYVYPAKTVQFQLGIKPSTQTNLILLEQTKLTGTDNFTDVFLEQDIGEVNISSI